jgi:hypothetical protein
LMWSYCHHSANSPAVWWGADTLATPRGGMPFNEQVPPVKHPVFLVTMEHL